MPVKLKGALPLLIIVLVSLAIIGISAGLYLYVNSKVSPAGVACTMEAKQCPDGSYVGRTGPNCEFAACPSPDMTACTKEARICPDGSTVGRTGPDCEFAPCPGDGRISGDCTGPDDSSCPNGYVCIQRCGPPVVRQDEPPPGYYCELKEVAAQPRNCPICLAASSMISTPDGNVNVKDIGVGMKVWSMDGKGRKVASEVVYAASVPVPRTHRMVRLVLSDGREVTASLWHPTTDGRRLEDLKLGDMYDGAEVVAADRLPYGDSATYDILPDTVTGSYWADGVPLRSTYLP